MYNKKDKFRSSVNQFQGVEGSIENYKITLLVQFQVFWTSIVCKPLNCFASCRQTKYHSTISSLNVDFKAFWFRFSRLLYKTEGSDRSRAVGPEIEVSRLENAELWRFPSRWVSENVSQPTLIRSPEKRRHTIPNIPTALCRLILLNPIHSWE